MAFKMNYNASSFPYKDSAYDKNVDPPNLRKPPSSKNDTINTNFPNIDIMEDPEFKEEQRLKEIERKRKEEEERRKREEGREYV